MVDDYTRIEKLSENLYNARFEIRLREASNLLSKFECGIVDKNAFARSTSLPILLDGINRSLTFILENPDQLHDHSKEPYQLLQVLLSLVQTTVLDPTNSISIKESTQILQQLYQLRAIKSTDGQVDRSIEEVITFLLAS